MDNNRNLRDLVVFTPKRYHILAEKNSKNTKTYKKIYEEIGVSKSMANQITNLFAVNEENQFEVEAFYETTIWSVFSKVDIASNTSIIYESVKEYSEKLKKRQIESESQVHFIWVGLSYHQIITAFRNAMKQHGLKSAMITFIVAQKRGCITSKEHTRIYQIVRQNENQENDHARKIPDRQALSFLDDLEALIDRIKDRFSIV